MTNQALRSEWIEGRLAIEKPEDVRAMSRLAWLGWGATRSNCGPRCSRHNVRGFLRQGGWRRPARDFLPFIQHQCKPRTPAIWWANDSQLPQSELRPLAEAVGKP